MNTQNIFKLILEQNQKDQWLIKQNKEFVFASIEKYNGIGLSYIDNDYYVYRGKGGLKIHETPKGVKKTISQIAHKYNLSVVVIDGLFYYGDTIDVVSNGTIEDIKIVKNSKTLIMGGEILAPYAIVSVFKDDVMITRKLFIVPNDEYKAIKDMGSGNKFSTMMAYKMVYKRVLNGIYSLLGVTLDRKDTKHIDEMAENMRVDDIKEEAKNITTEQKEVIIDMIERTGSDVVKFMNAFKIDAVDKMTYDNAEKAISLLKKKEAKNETNRDN